ncbi:hypothetical protein SCHIN_v1c06010 [Spiroplasma chinense]|uniref:Uncharacterized protein n=1 Tax=Spiroplasma chinense TaxID=216932 RepID=A0A5B9Y3R4_9MOLU|nr:hypothetical protein [Spiroplasma chinense]QEH61798.1 hypothetical protein SCHIN_v1c06010 [Spiroplasma chinense]
MKKLLSFILSSSLFASVAATTVSCVGNIGVLGEGPLDKILVDGVLRIKNRTENDLRQAIDDTQKLMNIQVDIGGFDPTLSNGEITLTPNEDFKDMISGSVVVKWYYIEPIGNYIPQSDLGEIKEINEQNIKEVLLAKNSNLKESDFTISKIGNNGAVVNSIKDSNYYYGKQNIQYSKAGVPDTRIDLATVITSNSLGELDKNDESTIISKIAALNSSLDKSEIQITNITNTGAKVTPKLNSAKYKGSVNVTFTIKETQPEPEPGDKLVELSTIIKSTTLGELENNSSSTIISKVKSLNSDLDTSQIEVANISDTGATIKSISNSTKYTGNVSVKYSLKETETPDPDAFDLSSLKGIALGALTSDSDISILNEFFNKNWELGTAGIKTADVKVIDKTVNSAVIIANSTKVKNSIKISFAVDNGKTSIPELIVNRNLGENIKELQFIPVYVWELVKKENVETIGALSLKDVTISNISKTGAHISAVAGSKFIGQVDVTWTVSSDFKEEEIDLENLQDQLNVRPISVQYKSTLSSAKADQKNNPDKTIDEIAWNIIEGNVASTFVGTLGLILNIDVGQEASLGDFIRRNVDYTTNYEEITKDVKFEYSDFTGSVPPDLEDLTIVVSGTKDSWIKNSAEITVKWV